MDSTLPAPKPGPTGRCTTLLKLAAAVAIFSSLLALAVLFIQRQLIAHRAGEVANDLKAFKTAFHAYALAQGSWPAATSAPGEVPAGMTAALKDTRWALPTPIGGRYTWDLNTLHRGHYYTAAISIRPAAGHPVSTNLKQLEAVDRAIDDGNLQTGRFVLGFHNFPVFVLEP